MLPQEAAPTRSKKKETFSEYFPNQDPKVDILLVNDTEIPLVLDVDQDCQRDCQCKGWQVDYSKEKEGWQKRLFSDKVRQNCGGPRTSRTTSAVFERNFFSCRQGRDSGCALWEGGPGPLKVEIFLQPSLTSWGLQKNQDVMVVVTFGRGVDLRPFL